MNKNQKYVNRINSLESEIRLSQEMIRHWQQLYKDTSMALILERNALIELRQKHLDFQDSYIELQKQYLDSLKGEK